MKLKTIVDDYLRTFPDERKRLGQLLELLSRSNEDSSVIDRKNFTGHVTASGIVLARDTGRVLKVYHRRLERYLQPGGHIEDEDISPELAAEREVHEETPIDFVKYLPYHFNHSAPIDIDTHFIDEDAERGESGHYHHDFRYLFIVESESVLGEYAAQDPPRFKWDRVANLKAEETFLDLAHKIDRVKDRDHREFGFYDAIVSSIPSTKRLNSSPQ